MLPFRKGGRHLPYPQIKALEDYSDQWTEAIDEQTKAEDERLAQQILGSNWRVKINKIDTGILNNFKTNFKQYNTQLTTLVNNEIAQLKNSIKAKEDEIKAKQNQIKTWEDYRTTVSNTIDTIKNKYSDYLDTLNNINVQEANSYADREEALRQFAVKFDDLTSTVAMYQSRLQPLQLSATFNDDQARNEMAQFVSDYREAILAMEEALEASSTGFGIVHSGWDEKLVNAINYLHSHAQGGVVDYTGLAMLHGSKSSAETVFNATQSKELYDMV